MKLRPSRNVEKLSLAPKTDHRGRTHLALGNATRKAHCLLDQQWDRASLVSRDGYAQFLMSNGPFVSIEVALEAAGIYRLLPDWDQRCRRHALIEDLRLFGLNPVMMATPPIAGDHGTLLGWCYVLEGSRLGGRLITNIVRSAHDVRMDTATSFVSHGNGRDYWRSFKDALAQIDQDEAAITRACDSAISCFSHFLHSSSVRRRDQANYPTSA